MGLTIGSHSLVHLFEGVLPPLIPLMITQFNTDYFHLGLVVTVFSYAFGLGSLPAGIIADSLGPRRLISMYLFGAGLFAILVWPIQTLLTYGIIMGFIGLCCSTYHPAKPIGEADKKIQFVRLDRKALVTICIFFLSATALGMTYKGIMTFLPTYMGTRVELSFMNLNSVTLGGTITTIALASGALGQYFAGRLVDRYSAEKLYLGAVVIGMICVFIMAVSTNALLVVIAVIYAFFYFSTQPIQNLLVSRYLPPHRQGLGYGILFFLTFGVGSTAAAVSGYIADRLGLEVVFNFMGICFIMSASMVMLLVLRAGDRR